jgi:hypothetical protein
MLFQDAFKALTEGKYVTRRAWSESGEYLTILPKMTTIFKIVITPSLNVGNCLFFVSDYLAEDWITLDDLAAEQAIAHAKVLSDAVAPIADMSDAA